MKSIQYTMVVFLWGLFAFSFAHGQVTTAMGGGPPDDLLRATWYLDTVHHQTWQWQPPKWKKFKMSPANSIQTCGSGLLFQSEDNVWITTLAGKVIVAGNYCDCYERMVQICNYSFCYYIQDTSFIAWAAGKKSVSLAPNQNPPITVNGQLGFCATASNVDIRGKGIENIHGWGVLGIDGSWLIEPKYDAPFKFQDGFAEVVYYGQKRRINEKGELVK